MFTIPRRQGVHRVRHVPVLLILILVCLSSRAVAADQRMDLILQELEAFARLGMQEASIPGMAYAVVKDDQIVDARGFGVQQARGDTAVHPETVFEIGSTSKAFTTALLAILADTGALSWKDKVRDHLPEFTMHDPWVSRNVLVEDLISQRSGMPFYALDVMGILGFQDEPLRLATTAKNPDFAPLHLDPERTSRSNASQAPLPLAVYYGRYFNPAYRSARVVQEDGGLAVILGPNGLKCPLTHEQGTRFYLDLPGYPGVGSDLEFQLGPSGPSSLVIEMCSDVRDGKFLRSAR